MGFMDKVKESIKSGADMAATKAQTEYEKMQVRRELADAYASLGEKAYELADRHEISHADLAPLVEQVKAAKDRLESAGKQAAEETPAAPPEPAAEEPPPLT
jgi:hypothetical protein